MSDSLVQLIKKIAMDAVRSAKMSDYKIGTVSGVSPLIIKMSNTLEIDEDFLHLSRNVTDYEVEIKIGDVIQSRTVLNSLKVGEKVLMLRKKRWAGIHNYRQGGELMVPINYEDEEEQDTDFELESDPSLTYAMQIGNH